MDEIKNLIKKYPDMKDIIVNSLLSELVKNKNVKREDIENIKHLSSTFNQPFTARLIMHKIQMSYKKWQYLKNHKIYKIMKI